MPLIMRLDQHTWEGFDCSCVEAMGAVESSRKFHRVVWKIPIQLLPASLMRGPDCRIDAARSTESISWRALEGWTDPIYRIDAVDSSRRIPRRRMEDKSIHSNTTGLRVLSMLPATAVAAAGMPPQSIGSICGP